MQSISILTTRLRILPNTSRNFRSLERTNTVPNIDECWSLNLDIFWPGFLSTQQQLLDWVTRLFIDMICPVMMNEVWGLTAGRTRHPDEAIAQHPYWYLQGSIQIHCLKHQGTGGKLILIWMITTPTTLRLAVEFRYPMSQTGGINKIKRTQSSPISPMWHMAHSLSYCRLSEWRKVFPLGETLSAGDSLKPLARRIRKKSYLDTLLKHIRVYWQAVTQHWIPRKLNATWTWINRWREKIAPNGQGPQLVEDVAGLPNHQRYTEGIWCSKRQETAMRYISDAEEIVKTSWSLLQHDGVAAF